jgi:hypothetical protein
LLHNRYLQWRFAIARAESVMYIQRLTSEETLFNVWHAISELQDHVTRQRIGLQQLKLEIKLNSLLNDQVCCLSVVFWLCIHQIMPCLCINMCTDGEP